MPEKEEEWNKDNVTNEDTEPAAEEVETGETPEVDENEADAVPETDTVTEDEAPLGETESEETEGAGVNQALFEAPKAKKKTNWTKVLTGCALILSMGGFFLLSQHLETQEAEQTAFEQTTWAESYLDTYEPVVYTFMDKAFLDEAANKDMKAWFEENEAKEGAYLYNIKGDEEYTYLLLSVGQQENNIIQLYDISQAEDGTLIMGYGLLDSEPLGIKPTTNTPTVFVRIAKTDAEVVARLIEEAAPEELVKITTEEIEGEEVGLTEGAEKVAEDIKEDAATKEATEAESADDKEAASDTEEKAE